jgi:LPS-assembly lipoprotein
MPNVTPALRAVDIVTPPGRAAYLLREQLNDELARDFSVPARYRLNLTVAEVRNPLGLQVSNVATAVELHLRVGYELVENATGKVLLRSQAPVLVYYGSVEAPYAGIAAQQDAQERAASQAAVEIRLDLSRRFARASRPPQDAAPGAAPGTAQGAARPAP